MRALAMAILMTVMAPVLGGCVMSRWGTAEVVTRAPEAAPPDRQTALDTYWNESRAEQQRRQVYDALHPAPTPAPAVDQTISSEEPSRSEERRLERESAARREVVRAALRK